MLKEVNPIKNEHNIKDTDIVEKLASRQSAKLSEQNQNGPNKISISKAKKKDKKTSKKPAKPNSKESISNGVS